jgi:hypothetical protein
VGSNKEKVFDSNMIFAVWNKGKILPHLDPIDFRLDYSGNVIQYCRYNSQLDFGWEIGLIIPLQNGGDYALSNLIPVEWQNKKRKENQLNTLNGIAETIKEIEKTGTINFDLRLPEIK